MVVATATISAALCLSTTTYVGPVANLLEGADLSSVVGPLVSIALYAGLVKVLYPRQFAVAPATVGALQPEAAV